MDGVQNQPVYDKGTKYGRELNGKDCKSEKVKIFRTFTETEGTGRTILEGKMDGEKLQGRPSRQDRKMKQKQ